MPTPNSHADTIVEPQVVLEREADVDYDLDHWNGSLFMTRRTKDTPNSEVLIAPLEAPGEARLLLEHRPDVKIEDTALSNDFFAVMERSAEKGLQECCVYELPSSREADAVRTCPLRWRPRTQEPYRQA